MRNLIILLAGSLSIVANPTWAQTPLFGRAGGIGSATSTYPTGGGEPAGGTYNINGATGIGTFKGLNIPLATYDSLNANKTVTSVNTGGCGPTDVLSGSPGNYSTAGFQSCIVTPTGSYTGSLQTWPDVAIGAYAVNMSQGGKASVPLFTFGGTGVSGALVYGANFTTLNCRMYASTCVPGQGFDTQLQYGLEVDTDRYSKPGGATPSGEVNGIISQLFGDTTSTGAMNAYNAYSVPGIMWANAYSTTPAAATYGAFYNSLCADTPSATCNSQGVRLVSRAGGVPHYADIFADSSNYVELTAPAGTLVNNMLTVLANANGVLPVSSASPGFVMTTNYIAGSAEVDIVNTFNTGSGFAWYQKTGANSQTLLARLDGVGDLTIPNTITAGRLNRPSYTPASSSEACTTGDEVADANYLYRCVSTNTWRRVALSAF